MNRPRALDLFCGAGGAGMGLHRAGFDVVGVDIKPQPRYPFTFHLGDALTWPLEGFDLVWASPPCQAYTAANNIHGRDDHPDLIAPVRDRLERSPQIGRTAKDGPRFRRKHLGTDRGRAAMGIDWMSREELSEAIPPAYSEHIGRHALMVLGVAA